MKRALLICLAIFTAIFFIPKKGAQENLVEHEMYLTDHEFHFIINFEEDKTFLQRVYSILDQEYENYHIHIYIDPSNTSVLSRIKTYAKKMSKEHFLTIIEKVDEKPFSILRQEILENISPLNVVIDLSKQCIFSERNTLETINSIFKSTPFPISLYSNFIEAPTYKVNTKNLTYENSLLKVTYTKDLLHASISKPFYLDKALYIKEEPEV